MTHEGACHCGNIRIAFDSAQPAAELEVRICACSFCSRHGARAVTDPAGRVKFTVGEPRHLVRYRFGHKTAIFLVCARCGVYVGAVMAAEAGAVVATLNVNALEDRDAFVRPPVAVDYESETEEQRRARRLGRWTPAEIA